MKKLINKLESIKIPSDDGIVSVWSFIKTLAIGIVSGILVIYIIKILAI